MNRCIGHCCRRFTLKSKDGYILNSWIDAWLKNYYLENDQKKVYEMLIQLEDVYENDEWRGYFTCKNLDILSGDCKIYSTRPNMCRNFPNDGICQYTECTLKEK